MPSAPIVLLVVFLAFAGPVSASEAIVLTASQRQSLGVGVVTAGRGGELAQGGLPGRVVVPNEQIRVVAAPVGGMIETLAVAPGAAVKRGQVLARLASPQALELQRDVVQAASQRQLAQQSLKRDEQLFAEGLIAESRLQASRAAAAQADALAAEKRQVATLAGVTQGQVGGPLALPSPIDGVVLEQAASVGQRVEASTLIYRIARLSPLWIEVQVPLALAAEVSIGTPLQVSGSPARGKLIAIGRAVDADSQSVLLRALVAQGGEALRPGQVVNVELALPASSAIPLPAAALARHAGQTVVFVQVGSEGAGAGASFQPRAVKVLRQTGNSAVVEGLAGGEAVAVKGVSGLKAMWVGVGKE